MRISRVKINNFRGVREGELQFAGHSVLVGDNNSGKSTVLEAIDLVLGPERLSKRPAIDEHDFYGGTYISLEKMPVPITVEVVVRAKR
jgi:putative ATP-dependent endonuclease of OLD family